MNIDEINDLLQQDDNDDIMFVTTEDEDFRGFSFNMELYQMVTWMFGWKIREMEDALLALELEVMSALLAFFESPEIWRQWVGCMVWFMSRTN